MTLYLTIVINNKRPEHPPLLSQFCLEAVGLPDQQRQRDSWTPREISCNNFNLSLEQISFTAEREWCCICSIDTEILGYGSVEGINSLEASDRVKGVESADLVCGISV